MRQIRPIPIYVSATLADKDKARDLAEKLEITECCTATHRWFDIGAVDVNDYPAVSRAEYEGVCAADAFIGILPGRLGAATELGIALALKKRIILVASDAAAFTGPVPGVSDHANIFWSFPERVEHIVCHPEAIFSRVRYLLTGIIA